MEGIVAPHCRSSRPIRDFSGGAHLFMEEKFQKGSIKNIKIICYISFYGTRYTVLDEVATKEQFCLTSEFNEVATKGSNLGKCRAEAFSV